MVHTLHNDSNALSPEEIERNKERLNRKPEFEYYEAHAAAYRERIAAILGGMRVPGMGADFENWPEFDLMLAFFSRMPEGMKALAGDFEMRVHDLVRVAAFDAQGRPVDGCTEETFGDYYVDPGTFPERLGEDGSVMARHHPTRVHLASWDAANGAMNFFAVPGTLTKSRDAVLAVRAASAFHEFFHRFCSGLRRIGEERVVMVGENGSRRPFAEWRDELLGSMVGEEPLYSSLYAEAYGRELVPSASPSDPRVEEHFCEAFASYHLDRAPNNHEGYVSFRTFAFGNRNGAGLAEGGYGSVRHKLMDELCRAKFEVLPKGGASSRRGVSGQ